MWKKSGIDFFINYKSVDSLPIVPEETSPS